jgi:hypothetical protein
MSATGRGTVRIEKDFYPTPAKCVEAIAPKVHWDSVVVAAEPCRGSGAIVQALKPWYDRQWHCHEVREGWDYLKADPYPVDVVITNPPYDLATDFLKRSLRDGNCVIYLLRINYLGSAKRAEFLNANRPTHLYVLSERPSFVDVCAGVEKPKRKGCGAAYQKADGLNVCPECGGKVKAGTDATEYAWFVWDRVNLIREAPGIYVLPPSSPKGSLERSERVPHPSLSPTPTQEPQR